MQTRKLYYEDSALQRFEAKVLGCEAVAGGFEVMLDATAFYPTGGGQACDLGVLGETRVLDVFERGHQVVHLCDGALQVDSCVTGSIDYARRLDLMQQHAGEHIVSGIICQRFGLHNVGFHIGADVVTIDFDGPITAEQLSQVEKDANAAIGDNLPIEAFFPSPEELAVLPYRSKKALDWPIRIVRIPGIDTCACCAVHLPSTLHVRRIKLLSCVKFHQGVRIEMVCGQRAIDLLDKVFDQNRQVSQAFSAKMLETGDAARKVNERLAAAEYRCAGLQKQVFAAVAEGFAGREKVLYFGDLTPSQTRELAEAILPRISSSVLVCGGQEGKFSFCLASHDDVKAAGSALCAALGGRGGGKPPFFQGSFTATREEIEGYWGE